ncbi:MAG: copper chaperone PCu(A)C [Paracoccaceae bacterium]
MRLNAFVVAAATILAAPAFAQDAITITDAYARSSGAMAKTGAAFMVIENHQAEDDRLLSAASDVAERVELHTHKESVDGVMQMLEVPEGFPVPANGSHALSRGGDHVMFLGLTRKLEQGETVTVTLTFEKAGEITVDVPVDMEGGEGGAMQHEGHGQMDHGTMKHGGEASN